MEAATYEYEDYEYSYYSTDDRCSGTAGSCFPHRRGSTQRPLVVEVHFQ